MFVDKSPGSVDIWLFCAIHVNGAYRSILERGV